MSMTNLAGRIAAVRLVERVHRFTADSDAIVDGVAFSDGERTAAATRHRARAAV